LKIYFKGYSDSDDLSGEDFKSILMASTIGSIGQSFFLKKLNFEILRKL